MSLFSRPSLPCRSRCLPRWDPRHMEPVVSQVLLILIGSGMTYCQGEGDCHGSTGMGGWRREECLCVRLFTKKINADQLSNSIMKEQKIAFRVGFYCHCCICSISCMDYGETQKYFFFLCQLSCVWMRTCESVAERWTYLIQDSSFFDLVICWKDRAERWDLKSSWIVLLWWCRVKPIRVKTPAFSLLVRFMRLFNELFWQVGILA